jgi:large subunit ribosomal protein L22
MSIASLANYRQSPRKVRVVADLVRGKSIDKAIELLDFAGKRAAAPLKKLILSAVANAENQGLVKADLTIGSIRIDQGVVMKRMMPRARGRGFPIKKRTSHVKVELRSNKADKSASNK